MESSVCDTAYKHFAATRLLFLIELLLSYKLQRHTVHAIAQSGWFRPVIENMAHVGITPCAQHLSPRFGQAVVNLFTHIFFGNRRPKAGPSRVRIKLRLGAEQWQLAGDAFKY